ncbi:MAG: hypothetical protein MPJ05_07300 [Nitrosopumilus sp.]|nr:hypothetical protein [Nitrosopumilus sp.]
MRMHGRRDDAAGSGARQKHHGGCVEANFRVCCSHKDTSKPCNHTIEAITGTFFNVTKIRAVKTHGGAEEVCVIGTAVIRPSARARFERDLKRTVVRGGRDRITRAKVVCFE